MKVALARLAKVARHPVFLLLLFLHLALIGPLLWSGGLPKGMDMNASLLAGYEAHNGSWHQLWDDSRFPGMPKHVSRFTVTELLLTWLVEVTHDLFLSMRLLAWGLNVVAALGMYFFVASITRSRAAGVLAAVVFVVNRSAALRIGLPLAAGYALLPWLFLAVDRTLHQPGPGRVLLLGLSAALLATATVPGFTYIAALAVVVYAIAFLMGRLAHHGLGQDSAIVLGKRVLSVVAGVAIALPLAWYYVRGLTLSTLPTVEETGGYDLLTVATNLPTLSEAFALSLPGFQLGTRAMDIAGWALVAVAAVGASWWADFRVPALVVIGLVSTYFAAEVDSYGYRLLADYLPYFSLVRGASRWLGVALLAYSVLLGLGLAGAMKRAGQLAASRVTGSGLLMLVALATGLCIAGVVTGNIWVQLPALRQWTTPYQLGEANTAPFEELAGASQGTAFATAPLLAERISGEPFLSAIDFGRTLGPGVSGRPALGGFRAGGLETGGAVLGLVQHLRTTMVGQLDRVVLSARPVPVGGPVGDFRVAAIIELVGVDEPEGSISIRFRQQGGNVTYAVALFPATGRIAALQGQGTRAQRVLASSFIGQATSRDYALEVELAAGELRAWLDGQLVLTAYNVESRTGNVEVLSSGVDAVMSAVEVATVTRGPAYPDMQMAKVLGLLNMGSVVVQPHTSQIERRRVEAMPGLQEVQAWGDAKLYRNLYHAPGKAFLAPAYGIFVGQPESVVLPLYHMDGVGRSRIGLVGADDVPEAVREEMVRGASFLAVPARQAESLNRTALPQVPPLVYLWDLGSPSRGVLPRPYQTPPTLYVTDLVEVLPRARNFVLETVLEPVPGADGLPSTTFRFRGMGDSSYYSVAIAPASGKVFLSRHAGAAVTVLAQAEFQARRSGLKLRIVAEGERFAVYVDDNQVLTASDDRYGEAGPIQASADLPGAVLKDIGVAADRDPEPLRQALGAQGFDMQRAVSQFPGLGRDHFNLFPHAQSVSALLSPAQPGQYRLVVGVANGEGAFLLSTVYDGAAQVRPAFERVVRQPSPTPQHDGTTWSISRPLDLKGGRTEVFAGVHGEGSRIVAMALVQAATVGGRELVDLLLSGQAPTPIDLDRASSTAYEGTLPPGVGGLLLFQEAFHVDWEGRAGGGELAHVRTFGTLNGFWVQASDAPRQLRLRFTPQGAYQRGLIVSGVSFLLLLGVGLAPVVRRTLGRR